MSVDRLDLTLDPQEEIRCRLRFRHLVKELSAKTHFDRKETESLLIIHYKLTRSRSMDRKYFRRVLYNLLQFQNDTLIDYIFSAFDKNNKLVIGVDSWVQGMSVLLRGTLDERIQICFRVYDFMNNGFLGREHMVQMMKSNFRQGLYGEDPEDIVRDLIDIMMKKLDRDRDGRVSFEDYRFGVWANNDLLEFLGQCLPSRPMAYAFMSTFTAHVSTMHGIMFRDKPPSKGEPPDASTMQPSTSQHMSALFGDLM